MTTNRNVLQARLLIATSSHQTKKDRSSSTSSPNGEPFCNNRFGELQLSAQTIDGSNVCGNKVAAQDQVEGEKRYTECRGVGAHLNNDY